MPEYILKYNKHNNKIRSDLTYDFLLKKEKQNKNKILRDTNFWCNQCEDEFTATAKRTTCSWCGSKDVKKI